MRLVGAHRAGGQSTAGHEAVSLKRSGKGGSGGERLHGTLAREFRSTEV